MIPALTLITGAYVIFRMIETLFLATSRYSGKLQHIAVCVLAGLTGVITLFGMISVLTSGSRMP